MCLIFLAFYIVRLVQFLMKTSLALNIAQSNFVCICLAVMGLFTLYHHEMSLMTTLSCIVFVFDAILGTAIFIALNQEDIYKELGVYKELKKIQVSLNCEGHISNLKMEKAEQLDA